jgi:hypothetical protein
MSLGVRRDRPDDSVFEPGEYGKLSDGTWHCCPPGTDLLGNLSGHQVVEHEDGTITVSPSILITLAYKHQRWHGYLERGVWREVQE